MDPCYPERYDYAARHEVTAALAPQVENGHVLDQTVWNYHFMRDANEQPSAMLNASGLDLLARLARTRPHPDPVIFLQTAQDLGYDSEHPDRLAAARNDLDAKRSKAIEAFLNAQTATRPVVFQVQIHDPAEVGIGAVPASKITAQMYNSYKGALQAGGASTTGGAGAATPGK